VVVASATLTYCPISWAYFTKAFNKLCKVMEIPHIYTKPYTPKTKGKAERFIQSSLRERAYAHAYNTPEQRNAELTLLAA
jgi:transposase InsO family protein